AEGGGDVDQADDQDGALRGIAGQAAEPVEGHQPGRNRRAAEQPAQHGADDDRQNGQAFEPAVGLDQQPGRQHFGDDAVLGGGAGGGADTHGGVGPEEQDRL